MTRRAISIVVFTVALIFPAAAAMAEMQLGAGYGREFRGNTDLEQLEGFFRFSLPYSTMWGETTEVKTGLELAGAIVHEDSSETDDAGRFSLMPQVIITPHKMINFIVGFGAGFVVGETEFTNHNLGGSFCLVSKVGLQFVISDVIGLEYTFFHQSNAGIYDYNASLNMNQVALTFHF